MKNPTNKTSRAVLVACMPKSGSTFLTELIAATPGFRREHFVPSYARREQELSEQKVQEALNTTEVLQRAFSQDLLKQARRPLGFVCQHHVKHNQETQTMIDRYEIVPLVLVRNIFDVVISLRDHVRNTSVLMPAAYVDDSIAALDDEQAHQFFVDMAIPWYINFYVSWARAEHRHFITYKNLMENQEQTLRLALAFGALPRRQEVLDAALTTVQGVSTRKNVGRAGRGEALSHKLKDQIRRYCSYYPDVDFRHIGIQ